MEYSPDDDDAEWVRRVSFDGRALAIRREQDRFLPKGTLGNRPMRCPPRAYKEFKEVTKANMLGDGRSAPVQPLLALLPPRRDTAAAPKRARSADRDRRHHQQVRVPVRKNAHSLPLLVRAPRRPRAECPAQAIASQAPPSPTAADGQPHALDVDAHPLPPAAPRQRSCPARLPAAPLPSCCGKEASAPNLPSGTPRVRFLVCGKSFLQDMASTYADWFGALAID